MRLDRLVQAALLLAAVLGAILLLLAATSSRDPGAPLPTPGAGVVANPGPLAEGEWETSGDVPFLPWGEEKVLRFTTVLIPSSAKRAKPSALGWPLR